MMRIAESSPNRQKTLWEMEKLLDSSNFSISHSFLKRLVVQTRKNQGLFGKGYLSLCLSHFLSHFVLLLLRLSVRLSCCSICVSLCLSIYLSLNLSVCLSDSLSASVLVCLSACLFLDLYIDVATFRFAVCIETFVIKKKLQKGVQVDFFESLTCWC